MRKWGLARLRVCWIGGDRRRARTAPLACPRDRAWAWRGPRRRVACPSTPVGHGAKLHCTARGELDSLNLRAGQVRRRVGGSFGMDADADAYE
jgi:hypothetical protein